VTGTQESGYCGRSDLWGGRPLLGNVFAYRIAAAVPVAARAARTLLTAS
jgi:hypothetical protein